MTGGERVIVLWIPDWPVHALRRELAAAATPGIQELHAEVLHTDPPIALVTQHRVVACCARARTAGVRTGMRERDAQAACPALTLHPYDPDRDARAFAPVAAALEDVVAGVETRRPGLAALRARGPARYYGDEESAAQAIAGRTAELGYEGARIGIADGVFAAEQAARATAATAAPTQRITLVPAGQSRAFLSPLPVERAATGRLATTLQGLGIHTLGAFAALPEEAVRQRFGGEGLAAYRRATAASPQQGSNVRPQQLARDHSATVEFETAVNSTAALATATAGAVAQMFAELASVGRIATGLRIELFDDVGARQERVWSHPSRFTPEDVLDRVRWQAESGALGAAGSALGSAAPDERGGAGITMLRITPTRTDRATAHEAGLWGAEPDDRVRHHLRGAQAARGRDSVGTASLRGGRGAAERQRFTPWGADPAANARHPDGGRVAGGSHGTTGSRRSGNNSGHSAGLPWHGAIGSPAPSLVFQPPLSAMLTDGAGAPVRITAEDMLTTDPAYLCVQAGSATTVAAWSTPWPVRERWWEGAPARFRLQVVLDTGAAWLLFHETEHWFAEGRYD